MARIAVLMAWLPLASAALRAEQQATTVLANALPPAAGGAEVYRAACAACHGPDGRGAPQALLGFAARVPDFGDCAFATAEADADWYAVVHEGGPVRALGREMPAFGDALTRDQIQMALAHLRSFCADRGWPQGDLNFPRAFHTEKAFPENEAVWTTGVTTGQNGVVHNDLVYERRFGARNQVELTVPVDFQANPDGGSGAPWVKGIGDVGVGFKRTFVASMRTGTIAAAGVEVILPTGQDQQGLGEGTTRYESFVTVGKMLPHNSFLQLHGGIEVPSDSELAGKEGFFRTALGTTTAQGLGYGRAWSPQVELLWARPFGEPSEVDIVPQLQVSLSKLQHVLLATGVRLPATQRAERKPRVLFYVLWDWFDGSLFSFWK
jgi:mono/diheme cytochrome c family protein